MRGDMMLSLATTFVRGPRVFAAMEIRRCNFPGCYNPGLRPPIAFRIAGVTHMPSFRSSFTRRALNAQGLASFTLQQFGTEFTAGPWKLTLSQLVRGADAASQISTASDQNAA